MTTSQAFCDCTVVCLVPSSLEQRHGVAVCLPERDLHVAGTFVTGTMSWGCCICIPASDKRWGGT